MTDIVIAGVAESKRGDDFLDENKGIGEDNGVGDVFLDDFFDDKTKGDNIKGDKDDFL